MFFVQLVNSFVHTLFRDRDVATAGPMAEDPNPQCCIHHLPPELLSQVLILVQLEKTHGNIHESIQSLQELAAVCRFWRSTVLAAPALWTSIHDLLSPIHLTWCLNRSGSLPISIQFPHTAGQIGHEFWTNTVVSQSHRWGEVYASVRDQGSEHFTPITTALKNPTPTLTNLTLKNERRTSIKIKLHEAGPALRHLDVTRCAIPWDSLRLRTEGILTYLCLSDLEHQYAPTDAQLISVLSAASSLETLLLINIPHSHKSEPPPYQQRKVYLPRLRELTIHSVQERRYKRLMQHLAFPFPACKFLSLHPVPLDQSPVFDHLFPGFIDQVRAMVDSRDLIRVNLYFTAVEINVEDREREPKPWVKFHLSMRVHGQSQAVDMTRQVATIVREALPNNNLHLQILGSVALSRARLFATASHVTVGRSWDGLFLRTLVQERPRPFPNLRRLDLRRLREPLDIIRSISEVRWTRVELGSGFEAGGHGTSLEVRLPGEGMGSTELWAPKPAGGAEFEQASADVR